MSAATQRPGPSCSVTSAAGLHWPATDNQRSMHTLNKHGAITDGCDYTTGNKTITCDDLVFAAADPGRLIHAISDVTRGSWALDSKSLPAVWKSDWPRSDTAGKYGRQ
jgi:hypothetical protein